MSKLLEQLANLTPEQRAVLQLHLQRKSAAPVDTIPRRDRSKPAPLSFAQQRLWLLHQLDPSSRAYNMPLPVRLVGTLDADALQRTLRELASRHETLRTTFPVVDGQPQQVVAADGELEAAFVDLTNLREDEREPAATQIAFDEAHAPFDLAKGPIVRAKLLRLREDDHVLLFTIHHIVSDGWSLGVLRREFGELYAAFKENKPSPLPELPIQYADFAVWQREWLTGDVLAKQLDYWRRQLDGVQDLELPTDRPKLVLASHCGGVELLSLPLELSERLYEMSRRH